MHFDPRLLFLVAPLGIALGASLGHGVHEAFNEYSIDFDGPHHGQEPLPYGLPFYDKGKYEKEYTIYKILSGDPEFSRITKAVNFVEDVASLLDDSSAHMTFFAPPDKVLRCPDHPHGSLGGHLPLANDPLRDPHPPTHNTPAEIPHGCPPGLSSGPRDLKGPSSLKKSILKKETMRLGETYTSDFGILVEALDFLDEFEAAFLDDDDEDKDKCKRVLKLILRAILHYHIIPDQPYDVAELARNTTYPTNLVIPGALDGKPLRLRVSRNFLPPSTSINFYTKIRRPDVKATNGIIHIVDHPLVPPPSVFQELYLAPRFFSTLTSALQRSGLTDEIDLRYVHDKGLSGASLVTIFAPTNHAFDALPLHLRLFLFSPFGEKVLRKLLQYHIVPNTVVLSNYFHRAKESKEPSSQLALVEVDDPWENLACPVCHLLPENAGLKSKVLGWLTMVKSRSWKAPQHNEKHKIKPIIANNLTLDTLFVNHTLQAFISQKEIKAPFPGHKHSIIDTRVFVNRQPVIVADAVGLNGAIHVVHRLLDPRGPHHEPHHPGHHHHHRHHHHHHHKHEHHHKHLYGDDSEGLQPHENHYHMSSDDTWDDWESWLIQWAEEQE